jgi:hypothetical protein
MNYYSGTYLTINFFYGYKNFQLPLDPDPAGSVINWPPGFRYSGVWIRGSGSERNIYGSGTLLTGIRIWLFRWRL